MIPPKRKNRSAKVKTKKAIVPYKYFVEIAADGALANGSTAGGLHVPVAILDASNRSDLSDVIAAHSHDHLNNGDIETAWTGAPDNSWIGLDINFKRPIETRAIIRFRMPKYAIMVNQAIKAKCTAHTRGKF